MDDVCSWFKIKSVSSTLSLFITWWCDQKRRCVKRFFSNSSCVRFPFYSVDYFICAKMLFSLRFVYHIWRINFNWIEKGAQNEITLTLHWLHIAPFDGKYFFFFRYSVSIVSCVFNAWTECVLHTFALHVCSMTHLHI